MKIEMKREMNGRGIIGTDWTRITRIARPLGNGSYVLVPKEWEGYEVILTMAPIADPRKEILKILEPYLESIVGIYFYGSYARGEQKEGSDIDAIVITNKKLDGLKARKPFDITFVERDKIELFKKANSILFYSFIFEGKPVLNESFLEELRKKETAGLSKNLGFYLEDTERALKINKDFIELDKLEKAKSISASVIYSVVLRLRGLFIAENLLKNRKFSNESFLKILKDKLAKDPGEFYELYRAIRDGKKPRGKVKMEEAERLINLLEDKLNEMRRIVNAK